MIKISDMYSKIITKEFYASRTGKLFANISSSIILRFINMLISFFLVPITLGYLDETRYGLWAALSSTLAWFFIFDVGIGNGLKNKYIELKAKSDFNSIRKYVSTAYLMFTSLGMVMILVFTVVNHYINWSSLLNAPVGMEKELSETVYIVFIMMCANFVLRLINTILAADLKNALVNGLGVVSHVSTFIGVLLLSKFTSPSILKYALLYVGSNLFVTFLASIILFLSKYKAISPSIGFINISLGRDLLTVGVKFFFLQIMGIVFFQSTSFIISVLVGPTAVTGYSITQKYFSLITMFFTMMQEPLWSGFGDAFHRGNHAWVRMTFQRLIKLWAIIMFALILMVLVQAPVFDLWLKGRISVDYALSILFVVYLSLQMWGAIYTPFINATSKLRLQMTLNLVMIPLFVVAVYFFIKYLSMGAKGLLVALILCRGLPMAILSPIQSYRILSGSEGIWQK